MPAQKVIIDTDPVGWTPPPPWKSAGFANRFQGIDDILSLLLLLSAKPEEIELELISLCQGNVEVDLCVLSTGRCGLSICRILYEANLM